MTGAVSKETAPVLLYVHGHSIGSKHRDDPRGSSWYDGHPGDVRQKVPDSGSDVGMRTRGSVGLVLLQ